jgi:hypothetical protein
MGTRTLLGRLRRPYRTEFVAAPRECTTPPRSGRR